MPLEPYTSTYTDVDGNIMDDVDLLREFDRVAEFLNGWAASIESGEISVYLRHEETIVEDVEIDPGDGLIQSITIGGEVETVNIGFAAREEGDPYRVYLVTRFEAKASRFTVSGPAGQTHIFSVNKATHSPAQTIRNGFYAAVVVVTYGANGGCFLNVFAHNAETTELTEDDLQGAIAT